MLKRHFGALGFALCLAQFAYAQASGKDKPAQAAQAQQKTAANPRSSAQVPPVVQVVRPANSSGEAKAQQEEKANHGFTERLAAWSTFAIAVLTMLLAIATGILARYTWRLWRTTGTLVADAQNVAARQAADTQAQLRAMRLQTKAMRRQGRQLRQSVRLAQQEFVASHRPKLRVRNVVILPWRGPSGSGVLFANGELVYGQLYVVNTGDTAATITESGCWVVWSKLPLPMARPYEGKDGNGFLRPTKLAPGATRHGTFASDTPLDRTAADLLLGNTGFHLWVMGWIEYHDDFLTPRRTSFCRQYIPGQPPGRPEVGHFRAVDNPDYEHEE